MFSEDVSTLVTSTATMKLFEVREDAKQLSEKKGEFFHSVVEKLLFIIKGSRPNLETAVGLLEKMVLKIDVDDWKILRRILRFFHFTLKEKRCFGATSLDNIFTLMDASYAVHHDMKSHTGCLMSMGLGVTHCRFRNQKLNTKSSTEAEIVRTSDYFPYNI